jgi:hypothetical protein
MPTTMSELSASVPWLVPCVLTVVLNVVWFMFLATPMGKRAIGYVSFQATHHCPPPPSGESVAPVLTLMCDRYLAGVSTHVYEKALKAAAGKKEEAGMLEMSSGAAGSDDIAVTMENTPKHIAVIMDGNRRYGRKR